jgi:uncharacterized protein (UPF0218 family)
LIEPYQKREEIVKRYLKKHDLASRTKIIPIEDKFGTTLSDQKLAGIIVSPETEKVALEINQLRQAKSWLALKVIKVPWVLAADKLPIHSTRIRAGEIDEEGVSFKLNKDWAVRKVSNELRQTLQKPLGILIKETSHDFESAILEFKSTFYKKDRVLVSVGDAVTDSLLKTGIIPNLSIIDLHIQRKKVYDSLSDLGFRDIKVLKKLKNEPGKLSFSGFQMVSELIKSEAKPAVLQIDGEEDLFTLFAILSAPLETSVVYGQPHEGVVVVEVTTKKKLEALSYLNQFLPV